MTSPQLQPVTIQHQRVLTPTGQTIQTLSAAQAVHAVQQQVQQVPVSNCASRRRARPPPRFLTQRVCVRFWSSSLRF